MWITWSEWDAVIVCVSMYLSSWSSKPDLVTVKLMMVTLIQTWNRTPRETIKNKHKHTKHTALALSNLPSWILSRFFEKCGGFKTAEQCFMLSGLSLRTACLNKHWNKTLVPLLDSWTAVVGGFWPVLMHHAVPLRAQLWQSMLIAPFKYLVGLHCPVSVQLMCICAKEKRVPDTVFGGFSWI